MSGTPSRDDFQRLFERVQQLESRIDDIEEENSDLKRNLETAENAQNAVQDALAKIDEHTSRFESLEETLDTIQEDVSQNESEHEGIADDLEELQTEVREGRQQIERTISRTNKRVTGIEHHLDLEESDILTAVGPEESELAHLAVLPERIQQSEIDSVDVKRALEVYDNFEKWEKPVRRGYIITSGELKRYLQEDLDWQQIYRMMEAFNDKSGPQYAQLNGVGSENKKCLIRWKREHQPT